MTNHINLQGFAKAVAVSSCFIVGSASAFVLPSTGLESKEIEIGACIGLAQQYDASSPSTGIGNVFALFNTPTVFGYGVNPHYDAGTGVPYSSSPDITSLTPAMILSECGVSDAVLTVTGVATGSYADEDLVGYQLEGKDSSNGDALTRWEVAVAGVTDTQVVAKKNSIAPVEDSVAGTSGTEITPFNALANDLTDGSASTLTNSILSVVVPSPDAGVVLDVATGLVTTTAAVPAGSYPITYQLCNAAVPTLCAQTTVTVKLDAAPVLPPVINDAAFTTQMNTPVSGTVEAGRQAPEGARYDVVSVPTSGQFSIDPTSGAFIYTPNSGFTGTDISTVSLCLAAPNDTMCDNANLTFTVQGGAVGTATPVPTLSEWSLIGLTSLVALFGASRMRKRQI